MAEIALIASIVQIADTGYRLSLKLYTSGEAISSADRAIITISKDISLTSTVLKELGEILGRDQDEKERICSENLVQTAGNTVKECLDVFEELDKMILKNMPNLSQGHRATRATMALEKLKWPFIQPRIQLLRGSLDMLRANISLMLNVMIYARHVSERKKSRAPAPDVYDEAGQKTLIEQLANAKEEYIRRFESLKLSSHATQNVPNIELPIPAPVKLPGSRATPAHRKGNVGTTQHSSKPLPRAAFQGTATTQWPWPNIPASCHIVSKDSVAVQSDGYRVWQLLGHFDALMNSLIREVYSPEYRIPAESRSRFTGAIREAHMLEVVEAKRRESTWSAASAEDFQAEPQLLSGTETNTSRVVEAERRESTRSAASLFGFHEMFHMPFQVPEPKRQRLEYKKEYPVVSRNSLSLADEPEPHLVEAGYSRADKAQGQEDQGMVPKKPRFDLVLLEEADKNDLVDDLVRMWTLVDL